MEFDLNLNSLFPERITQLEPKQLNSKLKKDVEFKTNLKTVIDKLGNLSAQAQGLPTVITLFSKFMISDNKLFVLKDAEAHEGCGEILGFLKIGEKDLFLHNEVEEWRKKRPLCVLDFYVNEGRQRQGCGKDLFDFMLSQCVDQLKPCHLAYDRPSAKLVPFLKKHYQLTNPIPQNNQFLVFPGFFSENPCDILDNPSTGSSKYFPNETKKTPVKRWFSHHDASSPMLSFDRDEARPMSESQKSDEFTRFEDVAIKPNMHGSPVKYSRHFSSPDSRYRDGNLNLNSPNSGVANDHLNYPVNTTSQQTAEKLAPGSTQDDVPSEALFTPQKMSQDWTQVSRKPIGSAISNPRGSKVPYEYDTPLDSHVTNAFIWMPSSATANHRVRAPYATTSPKAEIRTLASAPDKRENGNKRFQRTSLW